MTIFSMHSICRECGNWTEMLRSLSIGNKMRGEDSVLCLLSFPYLGTLPHLDQPRKHWKMS